jgi:hypothetical protein
MRMICSETSLTLRGELRKLISLVNRGVCPAVLREVISPAVSPQARLLSTFVTQFIPSNEGHTCTSGNSIQHFEMHKPKISNL